MTNKLPLLKDELALVNIMPGMPVDVIALITEYSRWDWKLALRPSLTVISNLVPCQAGEWGEVCHSMGSRLTSDLCLVHYQEYLDDMKMLNDSFHKIAKAINRIAQMHEAVRRAARRVRPEREKLIRHPCYPRSRKP